MHAIYRWFFPVVWSAFWLYRMLMARRVRKTKRSESAAARWFRIALIGFLFVLIAVPQFRRGFLGQQIVPLGAARFWIGAALLPLGLSFAVWARIHLGEYWSGRVTLKEGHRVIRTGPYRMVRHPIYSGIWLAFLGTAIALGQVGGFLACALLVGARFFKSRREERWLEEELGEEYERYRREVPALVPRVL